jgi:hypothetical protein
MEGFQKFILFAAIIILIIALVFIGVGLKMAGKEEWPPMVPDCPDYWLIDGVENNTTCINIKDLGICPPKNQDKHLKMNFNNPIFTGSNEMCAKYKWAKNCGVSWDGITYGVQNPCNST